MKRAVSAFWAVIFGLLPTGRGIAQDATGAAAESTASAPTHAAAVDHTAPLRNAASANERFKLTITPGTNSASTSDPAPTDAKKSAKPDGCRARLTEKSGREVWSARLVNETAPEQAAIHDLGKFVVTLDEFGRGGARHALVAYGPHGKKLVEFKLASLLRGGDWRYVHRAGEALVWLENAKTTFEPGDTFVIELNWGTRITIDLRRGKVDYAPGAGIDPDEAVDLPVMDGDWLGDSSDSVAAESDAAELDPATAQFLADALQNITALLYHDLGSEKLSPELKLALTNLQGRLLLGNDRSPEQVAELQKQYSDVLAAAQAAGLKMPLSADERAALYAAQVRDTAAGNSAATGVPVPEPDPAHRVNYMAWLGSQTETDGPSAFENFMAIVEHNKLDPAAALPDEYDKVMDGDAEALNAPRFLSFLEANRDNIALLRGALQRDYRGPLLDPSNEEALFSVLLPHLSSVRNTTKAMMAEARKLESEGRLDEALEDYTTTFASGAQISQGPTLIENLVGVAMQALGSTSLLDSMAGPNGAQLDYVTLAQQLESSYLPTRRMAETMQFERASVLDFVQRLYDYDPDTQQYKVSPNAPQLMREVSDMSGAGGGAMDFLNQAYMVGTLGAIGFDGMLQQVNAHYDDLTSATAAPFQQGNAQLQTAEARFEQENLRQSNPVLGALLPAISRANQLQARADTTRNATLLIANLNAYKQQNGAYPASLDAFAGKPYVTDPFTGQQFAYRRDGAGFQLYSQGADAADNGGTHNQRADRETGDLVFWPRPPKN